MQPADRVEGLVGRDDQTDSAAKRCCGMKLLLADTDLTVATVARMVGYRGPG
ncbi:MAG: hypothetical protein L0I24_16380 [Pseudonocardia sp.]|nr:hypothetical protein [Pseudonocardia sp.]